MMNYKWYLMVLGQYTYDDTGWYFFFIYYWYLVSISWYCLVLGGTGSAKGLYACAYWEKWRFGRVLSMPDTHTAENEQEKERDNYTTVLFPYH